jgi:hypothetical protein
MQSLIDWGRGVLLLLWVGSGVSAQAMFMWQETQSVPLDRLVVNLERKLAANTNDPTALYQLARLHSMRGATLSNAVDVGKTSAEPVFAHPGIDTGIPALTNALANPQWQTQSRTHFTNALRYYDRALRELARSTNAMDRWNLLPARLGYAWTLDQAGQTHAALREYRLVLDEAWASEMQVSLSDWWEQLKASWGARQWLGRPQRSLGPGVCFSEETIRYLLPHLDPVKDAAEIAGLQRRQARLAAAPRAMTPILIPAASATGLAELVDPDAAVLFDLDGSGRPARWGWIRDSATWLVWDPQGTGNITSGLQLIGGVTFWVFWRDGYEVLDALDDNGDGRLSGEELQGLALWADANSNGISESGEVVPANEAGLRELRTQPEVHYTGIPFHPQGATFEGTPSRPSFDWSPVGHPQAVR